MRNILLFGLLLGLSAPRFARAETSTSEPELEAIRAVANAYISAEPAKLRDAFLPTTNLYTTDDKEALRTIPFAEYLQRVAANPNASSEERAASIESIDRTGTAAVVKITTVRPKLIVTDYLSLLRVEKQWKVVNKTFSVEPRKPSDAAPHLDAPVTDKACSAPDHRRFDFMLGTWHTSDSGGTSAARSEGESSVEPMLDGCVVHEHRSLNQQDKRLFDGDAYWGYDSVKKQWLLVYLDDKSHAQVYEGRQEASQLAFYRERPDPDGTPILIRILYEPQSPAGYTQRVERSSDHGLTWQPGGITTYEPKP
jgi:hypothetical protein